MKWIYAAYAAGVACVAAAGFTIPLLGLASLGFVPLGAGLIWAAYDLMEVSDGKPPSGPQY